jgi:hypothetical protein
MSIDAEMIAIGEASADYVQRLDIKDGEIRWRTGSAMTNYGGIRV